ncbi:thioredoxin family protein [Aquibacillus salsiterrae]|uniref:Thioredoxin family protein n=1 Tax=Aquibacillus salsiterrae TaxID=2950439 RepID=A0A9X3WEJ7_9BACI|nr:thioredoxin family protein [Aquibacillus salsiterrae]MDC3417258.1 thioredoxin family protein [Aquibacillus salsiterrae]
MVFYFLDFFPYNKETVDQATIDQLDDPLYQNQILPDELSSKLENGEEVTIYFYSPTCIYCQKTTPILVPITDDLGVNMKKLNLLEFPAEWDTYDIEGTPTLVHFDGGEEAARITGAQPKEKFEDFFNTNVLHEKWPSSIYSDGHFLLT